MFGNLLLLAIVVLAYFWVKSWYKSLDETARKKAAWNIAVVALFAIMLLAVATGRMHWAGLAFAFVLGALRFIAVNALRFAPFLLNTARQHNYSSPEFRTPYLNVKVRFGNPLTLEGSVIDGPHKDANLQSLTHDQLVELANFYKDHCKRSYYLMLLQLQHANQQGHAQHVVDTSAPTRTEAMQILGLTEGFTPEDVKLAHRRLMQKLHPDKGGNAWLASRVNLAKDILLGNASK